MIGGGAGGVVVLAHGLSCQKRNAAELCELTQKAQKAEPPPPDPKAEDN